LAPENRAEADRALAEANQLRVRGELPQAEQKVLSVLRDHPRNVDAHALLGEINFDMGRMIEAANWLQLALDLQPDNPRLKARLTEAQSRSREDQLEEVARSLPVDLDRPNRLWAFGLLIVLGGAVAGAGFWAGRATFGAPPSGGPIRKAVSLPADPRPDFESPAPQAQAEAPAPTSTLRERALLATLRGILPAGSVEAALEDPRMPSVGITLRAPEGADFPALACQAAAAALEAEPELTGATVRIFQDGVMAYVADASRTAFNAIRSEGVEPKEDPQRLLSGAQTFAVTPTPDPADE
jgi:tetratricopeptide (TPR) repeat protein